MRPVIPLIRRLSRLRWPRVRGHRLRGRANSASWWLVALLCVTVSASAEEQSVRKELYGRLRDGSPVDLYTLTNPGGLEATVMTLGATLTTVKVPDREGRLDIVILHRDSLEEYLRGHPLLGSVVGRFANRIAGARFTLDGKEYRLEANAGANHIHGGGRENAFHWQLWSARPIIDPGSVGVRLSLVSPDGQAGYPGRLEVTVEYRLTSENELVMDYTARTDKPTHINLTNHAYWNLRGADSGDVFEHILFLNADRYLVSDRSSMPTGEIRELRDSPMSFIEPRSIGSRLDEIDRSRYDHCYVLNKNKPSKAPGQRLSLAARVVEPESGRIMEVFTTQPGVQFYTGNRRGFCLETQHFPNTPNEPSFPGTVLRPGETYSEVTIHRFRVDRAREEKRREEEL